MVIDVRIQVIMPKQIANEAVYQGVVDRLIERGYAGATTKPIAERADWLTGPPGRPVLSTPSADPYAPN